MLILLKRESIWRHTTREFDKLGVTRVELGDIIGHD